MIIVFREDIYPSQNRTFARIYPNIKYAVEIIPFGKRFTEDWQILLSALDYIDIDKSMNRAQSICVSDFRYWLKNDNMKSIC